MDPSDYYIAFTFSIHPFRLVSGKSRVGFCSACIAYFHHKLVLSVT